jgi:hypothetical protein
LREILFTRIEEKIPKKHFYIAPKRTTQESSFAAFELLSKKRLCAKFYHAHRRKDSQRHFISLRNELLRKASSRLCDFARNFITRINIAIFANHSEAAEFLKTIQASVRGDGILKR